MYARTPGRTCIPLGHHAPACLPCPPAEETLAAADGLRDEPPTSFLDRVFDNEMNIAVERTRAAYDRMLFREALKAGW